MQTIELIAGDYDWTTEGSHVWDENGFSIVLTESKTIEVADEVATEIIPHIEASRACRGLNPDGSIPEPAPVIPTIPDEP